MSLKFLNCKGWHPSNRENQRKIWIAEQKAIDKEQSEKDAAVEVKKQAEIYHYRQIASLKGDKEATTRLNKKTVDFMYAPPPGLAKAAATSEGRTLSSSAHDEGHPPKEDNAVVEFKRKFEKSHNLPSSTLERYVGRKPSEAITMEDQVQRFPMLKDAPVEGEYTSTVKVNFKPMGVVLRNVKCLRCGEWGHQSGDRECSLRDFNPHDAARQAREDPIAYINQVNATTKQDLVLKRAALPVQVTSSEAAKYDILPSPASDEEDEPKQEGEDAEQVFLASLSTKDKKLLLKKLKQQEVGSSSSSRLKKKRKKETKKRARHATGESDSGSSSREDRREARKSMKKEKKKTKKRHKKKSHQ